MNIPEKLEDGWRYNGQNWALSLAKWKTATGVEATEEEEEALDEAELREEEEF